MSKPKSGYFNGTFGSKVNESKDNSDYSPSSLTMDKNKIRHIFNNPRHNLEEFLKTFNNDEEAAFNKLQEEYNNYIKSNNIKNGTLRVKVQINAFEITIRGIAIDCVGYIGTAYIGED